MASHWLCQSDGQGALPPFGLRPIHPRDICELEMALGSDQ
jgi:hypothetical protein